MLLVVAGVAGAQTPETVRPAHDGLEPGTHPDDLGITIVGIPVDYHADRGNSKSTVVFYRSAVW